MTIYTRLFAFLISAMAENMFLLLFVIMILQVFRIIVGHSPFLIFKFYVVFDCLLG